LSEFADLARKVASDNAGIADPDYIKFEEFSIRFIQPTTAYISNLLSTIEQDAVQRDITSLRYAAVVGLSLLLPLYLFVYRPLTNRVKKLLYHNDSLLLLIPIHIASEYQVVRDFVLDTIETTRADLHLLPVKENSTSRFDRGDDRTHEAEGTREGDRISSALNSSNLLAINVGGSDGELDLSNS
jgi:hypothetical protein